MHPYSDEEQRRERRISIAVYTCAVVLLVLIVFAIIHLILKVLETM